MRPQAQYKSQYNGKDGRDFLVGILPILFILLCPSLLQAKPFISTGIGAFSGNKAIYGGFTGILEGGVEVHHIVLSLNTIFMRQNTIAPDYAEGTITLVPIMFDVYGNVPLSKRLRIRFGGGYGYVVAGRELQPGRNVLTPGWSISEDLDSGTAFAFRGGLEYRVTKFVSLCADVHKIYFQTKIHETRENHSILTGYSYRTTRDIDLDGIYGFGGVKIFFY